MAVLAAAVALAVTALVAPPAHAGLTAVGPVNPATTFPDWYQDTTGLKLQLCLDGLPVCSAAKGDLSPPDGEAFWWRAQADVPVGGGTAKMALAQEAAYLGGPVTFGRIRVTVVSARPSTTYTVTHPYGTLTVQTDTLGNGRSSTDFGCGASPCNWAASLTSPLGPFLHWDGRPPAPQAGYIGDAATPHTVVGSPTGFNGFRVSGGGVIASTNLLTVEGKLAGPPVPVFSSDHSAIEFGPVLAGAPAVLRTTTVTNLGVPAADGTSNLGFGPIGISGPDAADFTLVGNTCSGQSIPSGGTCALTVAFRPGAIAPRVANLDVVHNSAGAGTKIPLSGTGSQPVAASVAGASASSRLRISKLRTSHRMSRARVLGRGLRLSMRVPAGTEILKIAVYRTRSGKVIRKPVWLGYRVVGRVGPSGLYRIRLDSRALRQRLKAGLYQLNVTPGVSKHQLGRTTSTRIRITRR